MQVVRNSCFFVSRDFFDDCFELSLCGVTRDESEAVDDIDTVSSSQSSSEGAGLNESRAPVECTLKQMLKPFKQA